MQCGVHLLDRIRHGVLQRVYECRLLLASHVVESKCSKTVGDIALVDHEAHEHVLVGQFLLESLGIEAVEHIVVLHRGV